MTVTYVNSALKLPWPARLQSGPNTITGRAWLGAGAIFHVEYSIDRGEWQPARLTGPDIHGAWTRFEFDWELALESTSRDHVRPTREPTPSRTASRTTSKATSTTPSSPTQ